MVLRVELMILQLVVFEVIPQTEDEAGVSSATLAPLFRIVAYDPKSKATSVFMAEPEYIVQVAGGAHSGYLEPSRRKELARIVCESLTVIQRRGKPFELSPLQPAGAKGLQGRMSTYDAVEGEETNPAFHRRGKIGRFAASVSGFHVIMTFYTLQGVHPSKEAFANDASLDLIVNVYSQQRSLSRDFVISTQEQVDRLGKTILSFKDGFARTTALRHLSKSLTLCVGDPRGSDLNQELVIGLLPPSQEYLPHYKNLSDPGADAEPRPIGAPVVFLPLNTCGDLIHRRTTSLCIEGEDRKVTFIISVHCKAPATGPEKGLVMKLYESVSRQMVVVHIGPVQLDRSCAAAGRSSLLQDVAISFIDTAAYHKLDSMEQSLLGLTEKGEESSRLEHLVQDLIDVLLVDMSIRVGELNTYVPYFLSAPKPT